MTKNKSLTLIKSGREKIGTIFAKLPFTGWLLGILLAVLLECGMGKMIASLLGLFKIPVLFGFIIMLKKPILIPGAFAYVLLIYVLPVTVIALTCSGLSNRLAKTLYSLPMWICVAIHLALLYAALHLWATVSDYRLLVVKLTMIAIMLTLSINVINGYMGEFSCSHPGFMALGAYASSTVMLLLFVNDKLFGAALLPSWLAPFFFPAALVIGGIFASLGALLVAIPSFRTRGDYLAIISLAFMFIVKSVVENLEVLGGPRGMSSQPPCSTLTMVFAWTVICIWVINNFVRSTMGKALNAVRDNEIAAEAMTVNTRRTKMTAFLFGAFWAGVAGGLFAHVLRYINPGTFGVQKLAEIFAMLYFGGLNSVYGSIVGAVSFNLLSEALRPLELFKWIIIPVMLILVMIFRPRGLISFKEFDVEELLKPKG